MAGKFLYCMLCKSPPEYWVRSLCHSVIVYLLTTLETPDVNLNREFYKIKGILWPWEFIGSFCFSSPEVIILFVAMNVGCFTKKCSVKLSIRHLLFEKKQFLEHNCVKNLLTVYILRTQRLADVAIWTLEEAMKPAEQDWVALSAVHSTIAEKPNLPTNRHL